MTLTPALMKTHPHLCFLHKALTPAPLPIVGEGKRERGLHHPERIREEGASSSEREKGRVISRRGAELAEKIAYYITY